ncbi:MAG: hypothetical protein Q8M03_01035 [Legionella sp.]|nr:hypothetical protein [Legionella sp.]
MLTLHKNRAFRDTIKEQEEKSKEEEELEELKKKREEERKQETRKLLATEVQKLLHKEQEDSKRPDEKADNEDDQEEEFNLWKEREKARIRRDREERQRYVTNRIEIEWNLINTNYHMIFCTSSLGVFWNNKRSRDAET